MLADKGMIKLHPTTDSIQNHNSVKKVLDWPLRGMLIFIRDPMNGSHEK
jgi:hypothetical protein